MCITTTRPLHCQQQQQQQQPQKPRLLKRRLFLLPTQRQRRLSSGAPATPAGPAVLLPSAVTKKRRLSKIRFPNEPKLMASYHTIPSRCDLSADELNQCYYKKKELKVMKSQATSAMRHYEQQQQRCGTSTSTTTCCLLQQPLFCTRGLERRSLQGAKQFRQNKTKGWRAVFVEQARQRQSTTTSSSSDSSSSSEDDCTMDKQCLAKIYQEVTQPSLWAAQAVAEWDAQQAKQIYQISADKTFCTAVGVVEQKQQ